MADEQAKKDAVKAIMEEVASGKFEGTAKSLMASLIKAAGYTSQNHLCRHAWESRITKSQGGLAARISNFSHSSEARRPPPKVARKLIGEIGELLLLDRNDQDALLKFAGYSKEHEKESPIVQTSGNPGEIEKAIAEVFKQARAGKYNSGLKEFAKDLMQAALGHKPKRGKGYIALARKASNVTGMQKKLGDFLRDLFKPIPQAMHRKRILENLEHLREVLFLDDERIGIIADLRINGSYRGSFAETLEKERAEKKDSPEKGR